MDLREEDVPYSHVAAMTVLFFVATTSTACAVDDLGTVFQLIGGFAGSLLIFVLPGALLIADRHRSAPAVRLQAAPANVQGLPVHEGEPILWDGGPVPGDRRQSWSGKMPEEASLVAATEKMGGRAEHETTLPALAEPDGRPCYESRRDTPAVGCVLVLLGVCVMALTLYTSIAPLLPGYKDSKPASRLHGNFMIHASHTEAAPGGTAVASGPQS
jgi:hypothetical protein